jgi:hypothetical protein
MAIKRRNVLLTAMGMLVAGIADVARALGGTVDGIQPVPRALDLWSDRPLADGQRKARIRDAIARMEARQHDEGSSQASPA